MRSNSSGTRRPGDDGDGNRLRIRGHRRDTLLVTFAKMSYEVAADHKTFGACAGSAWRGTSSPRGHGTGGGGAPGA